MHKEKKAKGERIMLTIQEMKERLIQAHEDKSYISYGVKDFDSLTDKEIEDSYITMQNYLSDARTHRDY